MNLLGAVLASLPLTVLLHDGTRLHSTPRESVLSAWVDSKTMTNLAWKSIRSMSRAGNEAWVVESHSGRRLQVRPAQSHLVVDSVLGTQPVPWSAVDECHFETTGDAVTWLTAAGSTGFRVDSTGVITVTAGRAHTAQAYRLPMTVDCEVMLQPRDGPAENWLEWTVTADKRPRTLPAELASVRAAAAVRTKDGLQPGLILRLMHTAQNTARRPGEPPLTMAAGVWHRVRIQFGTDRVALEWNGRPYELQGISLPRQPVRLAMASRDPQQSWVVRRLAIREVE